MFNEIKHNKQILSKLLIFHFRIGQKIIESRFLLIIKPFWKIADYIMRISLNCEIHPETKIGYGLKIYHPFNIIINSNAIIGENCILRHNITIGNNGNSSNSPVIGNDVNIGCGSAIIGDINIGDNTTIAANAFVNRSFDNNSLLIGNPCKNYKKDS